MLVNPSGGDGAGGIGVTIPHGMLISVVLPAPFEPQQRENLAAGDPPGIDIRQRFLLTWRLVDPRS